MLNSLSVKNSTTMPLPTRHCVSLLTTGTSTWFTVSKLDGQRARLHQASASIWRQRCVCNIALIDHNGVAPKWVATPLSSDSIVFNESLCRKRHRSVDADAWCKRAQTLQTMGEGCWISTLRKLLISFFLVSFSRAEKNPSCNAFVYGY